MEIPNVPAAALLDAGLLRREAVGDAAVVVTDLDKGLGGDSDAAASSGTGALDASLTCVVVGLTDTADPLAHRLAPLCDVVLARADRASLAAIAATVAAKPVASRSLAGLLRGAEHRSLDDGLLAESAVYSALQAGSEFATWRSGNPPRQRSPEGEPVSVARTDGVLDVTLDRPHVRNAFSSAMRDALVDALDLAALDTSVTEVHLRGAGPAFCAGGDLDEFGSFADPAGAHLVRLAHSAARAIAAIADRVIAHLHGTCVGSGIELPAFARTVLAAPTTTIALPEVALGLIPGAGGTVSLPRRIGRHRTARLALTGMSIDATTALAWGLIDEIEPCPA